MEQRKEYAVAMGGGGKCPAASAVRSFKRWYIKTMEDALEERRSLLGQPETRDKRLRRALAKGNMFRANRVRDHLKGCWAEFGYEI
jgi:hypothetical protein